MRAAARPGRVLAFAGAVLLGAAYPALASDGTTGKPLTQMDLTLAGDLPLVPSAVKTLPNVSSVATTVPNAPAETLTDAAQTLTDAAQTRPISIGMPETQGVFAGPSLRRGMYVSFAALQVMDAVTTRQALNGGAREANPAMAGIVRNNAALFAVKAGSAAATAYFAERLAKNHPRRAAILMVVLNTAYAAVVAHNYQVARAR